MRARMTALFCLALLVAACGGSPAEPAATPTLPAPTETPPFPPTPVLPQATDILVGPSAVPKDALVFVEYVPLDRRCALVEELADPIYELHQSGTLDLRVAPTLVDGASALYGEADWAGFAASVTPVRELPFAGKHRILAIRSDGTLVAEIESVAREIEPGSSWTHFTGRFDCGGGWVDYSYEELKNHGLIDREMLNFLPES